MFGTGMLTSDIDHIISQLLCPSTEKGTEPSQICHRDNNVLLYRDLEITSHPKRF